MAYDPLPPTGLDQQSIPHEVQAEYFTEVLFETNLRPFMGRNPMSPIQVIYKEAGSGSTITVPFKREIDYKNPIKGNFSQVSGKGQIIKFYDDTVTVNKQAFNTLEQSPEYMRLDTPVDVFNAMKPSLVTAHSRNLVFELLQSATTGLYTLAQGPVAARVLYGSKAYNATIQGGIDSMVDGATYNGDGLSVNYIRKLRQYAVSGGPTYEGEKRIAPVKMDTKDSAWSPEYVFLMDPASYQSLCGDPLFSGMFVRGTIESPYQPSALVGAFYRGRIEGVMIYECPELANFRQANTGNTFNVSWNLFMGAQAFILAWGKQPWFDIEYSNHKQNIEMAMFEIRGQKAFMLPSFSNEAVNAESGLIHAFTKI